MFLNHLNVITSDFEVHLKTTTFPKSWLLLTVNTIILVNTILNFFLYISLSNYNVFNVIKIKIR